MSVLPVGIGSSGGYEIPYSLRFRASNSAYLSRTFGTPTLSTKWTFSTWVKRGTLTVFTPILQGYSTLANRSMLNFDATDHLYFGGPTTSLTSSAVYRDPTAHMHILCSLDTSQAAADRLQIWVNGSRITLTGTNNPGTAEYINQNNLHYIARSDTGSTNYGDFVQSEINFIDGQALTPSSFGETNSDGVWVPKRYTGTYGTNGFYLDFKDGNLTSGSNAGLGKDVSGNGNYWNTNGISVTAGVTYDWMYDTPTNNYATLSPISAYSTVTFSAANLKAVLASGATARGTIGVSTGKWYWESTVAVASTLEVGVIDVTQVGSAQAGYTATGSAAYQNGGNIRNNNALVGAYASFAASDVIALALDCDASPPTLAFYKNNSLQTTVNLTSGVTYTPQLVDWNTGGGAADINFGQRPFTYTPPTGFKALCTANLPSVAITNPRKHFDVVTSSTGTTVHGGGVARSITSLQFQPDLVVSKNRSNSTNGRWGYIDAVRGVNKTLASERTDAEVTTQTDLLTAFLSNGFTLGADASGYGWNYNQGSGTQDNYVYTAWKANGAGVSNTDGSITSTVSANTTAGFSIVTYTGTGVNATVGHGLGVAPKMVIVKQRNAAGNNWAVYTSAVGNTGSLFLSLTNAVSTDATYWNNTSPTSTTLSVGSSANVNGNTSTYVAYCFAEIPGFSKFGSYTGNGSTDGPFVYCGFRPKWVMVKLTSNAGSNWWIADSARNTYNLADLGLLPNSSSQELTNTDYFPVDFTANGFKLRGGSGTSQTNFSGYTYIYAAFAEHPFGGSNIAPSPAR